MSIKYAKYSKAVSDPRVKALGLIVLISLVVFFGVARVQSEFAMTSVWDVDVEFRGIEVDGTYEAFDEIDAVDKSLTKITYDPDGDVNYATMTSMNSPGLLPQYQWSLGSFFHTNKDGVEVLDAHPKEDVVVDGIRILTYYFGYSLSMITRGDKDDLLADEVKFGFDYYGQDLNTLYELPEFATGSIMADVGIRLDNSDQTIPSICGVQEIKTLRHRTVYTAAASFGQPDDIDDFNRLYDWKSEYKHEGFITDPVNILTIGNVGTDAANVKCSTTMSPGSEYIVNYDGLGGWVGGSFNLFDVEVIVDYMVELQLTYEIAADVGHYLANRLDIMVPEEPTEGFDWILFAIIILIVLVIFAKILGKIF
jgi:hypothetical protein